MKICQLPACLFLVLTSQLYTISGLGGNKTMKGNCRENEYWNKKGFCCDKCHPGFKLKKECHAENMRSECEKCDEGTYLEQANYYPNCFRCQECKKPHFIESSPCTPYSNRVCDCLPGYYKKKLGDLGWECSPCKTCGDGQIEIQECTKEENTQCKCQENHYPASKNSCKLCDKCQSECDHLCKTSIPSVFFISTTPNSPEDTVPQVLVPVCASIMVLSLAVFMAYEGIRHWRKRVQASSSQSSSPAREEEPLFITVVQDSKNESVSFTNQPCESKPLKNLPDCIPREIKIHEFFYFVLDEVPIGRFKELVRRLGVSEQNIDRAEQDHRNCKDAQYQMLKVWSDGGSGGGNNVLPYDQIQMLIGTLKDMCLVSCADNIENKFLSQYTSVSL
ncbi:tumor necrosis factor receptor superfamily member 1A [Danio aesculapii]|uniref:tumor necrosis factor receptor superfamily member 1A n=1 Tax=Danio aesculapii TaxID=1142201 RepID=UPI0024BF4F7A|nr:tumor necrosis factor receptor superfamily member 1A [Danio aesculapii]XP_056331971.1 tumor necrosis factor receptor superfamily member 1A [Danio aesculapii]